MFTAKKVNHPVTDAVVAVLRLIRVNSLSKYNNHVQTNITV